MAAGNAGKSTVMNDFERKYQKTNQGPYTIWIQAKKSHENDGKRQEVLSPYKVGKIVCDKYSEVTVIEKENRRRVEVTLKTREAANRLAEDKSLSLDDLEATIPPYRLSRKGIIRDIDTDITEEDIMKYIESPVNIIAVRRINRRNRDQNQGNGNEWIPTKSVTLIFEGQSLPCEVFLFKIKNVVRPYVTTPRLCNKCFKPGHIAQFCRSPPKCFKCGQNKHDDERCMAEKPQCVNCQGEHNASYKQCVVYRQEMEIRRLMAYDNISLTRARRLVLNEAKQGPIINKENFPSLTKGVQCSNESYSSKIQTSKNQSTFKKTDKLNTRPNTKKDKYTAWDDNENSQDNSDNIEKETAEGLLELSQSVGYEPTLQNREKNFENPELIMDNKSNQQGHNINKPTETTSKSKGINDEYKINNSNKISNVRRNYSNNNGSGNEIGEKDATKQFVAINTKLKDSTMTNKKTNNKVIKDFTRDLRNRS